MIATIAINGRKLNFKLDTGAEVTAISEQEYKKLDQPPLDPARSALYGPSRQPLQTAGQFTGKLRNTAIQPVFVVKGLKTNVLGLPAITALKLDHAHISVGMKYTYTALEHSRFRKIPFDDRMPLSM